MHTDPQVPVIIAQRDREFIRELSFALKIGTQVAPAGLADTLDRLLDSYDVVDVLRDRCDVLTDEVDDLRVERDTAREAIGEALKPLRELVSWVADFDPADCDDRQDVATTITARVENVVGDVITDLACQD